MEEYTKAKGKRKRMTGNDKDDNTHSSQVPANLGYMLTVSLFECLQKGGKNEIYGYI